MSGELLRLLQLASPTLPVGAYAYSQGLESAVQQRWVHDQMSAQRWISGILITALTHNDLVLLAKAHQAWCQKDALQLQNINHRLLALRETAELWQEDIHLGRALWRLARDLDIPLAQIALPKEVSYAVVFAGFAAHWQLSAEQALTAYAWSWAENQIAAAIKLVPLGQTQGQKILMSLDGVIVQAVHKALQLPDEDIGLSLPALAIVSAEHELQYSRLFRS